MLDLTGAVQVALLESPTYQQQLETLVSVGARRHVRAVPIRFAVLWRNVDVLHGGRLAAVWAAGGSSVLEVNPSRPENPYRVEKVDGDRRRAGRWVSRTR